MDTETQNETNQQDRQDRFESATTRTRKINRVLGVSCVVSAVAMGTFDGFDFYAAQAGLVDGFLLAGVGFMGAAAGENIGTRWASR